MKRQYTISELKEIDNRMMNYVADVSYCGAKTTLKIHVGTSGNHFDIIRDLVKKEFGEVGKLLGARITGKAWS